MRGADVSGEGLAAVGFTEIALTHTVADGVHAAIVRATKLTAAPQALDGRRL
ncbi:hypothetical protein AB0E78_07320 [Streptomyces sp. NPDC032198]|uniref:hypothetical protein n=1 Tax=Streptomyces sp. NPDC032198 TaxID=3155127 RepID=UPI003405403F